MTQEERQKDEKIRKALIKLFQDCGNTDIEFCNTGFSYQEIFTWLEKQGKPNPSTDQVDIETVELYED